MKGSMRITCTCGRGAHIFLAAPGGLTGMQSRWPCQVTCLCRWWCHCWETLHSCVHEPDPGAGTVVDVIMTAPGWGPTLHREQGDETQGLSCFMPTTSLHWSGRSYGCLYFSEFPTLIGEKPAGHIRWEPCSQLLSQARVNPGFPAPMTPPPQENPEPGFMSEFDVLFPGSELPTGWCSGAVSRSAVGLGVGL